MGAGKTTVGQALAARLGWAFTDLDRLIERRDGRTIEQIFRHRRASFREIEHESLREALESFQECPSVLALGGGASTRRRESSTFWHDRDRHCFARCAG